MKTLQVVRNHLASNIKYRNDDRLLRLKVWEDFGFRLTPEQKKVYWDLPSDGAISRYRRGLREDYPESEEIMNKRFNLFKKEREEKSEPGWLARRLKAVK